MRTRLQSWVGGCKDTEAVLTASFPHLAVTEAALIVSWTGVLNTVAQHARVQAHHMLQQPAVCDSQPSAACPVPAL